jgi:hypothetical protein
MKRLPKNLEWALCPLFVTATVALCLVMGYIACAGPAYYVEQRFILYPSVPSLKRWLQPADYIASRSRPYYEYLKWWAREGTHAAAEEDANARPVTYRLSLARRE